MKFRLDKFDRLVESFCKIGGIGRKSAVKYAYAVSVASPALGLNLSFALEEAARSLVRCGMCGGVSEANECPVCDDSTREKNVVCVVADAREIFVLEQSGSFNGLYFVFDSRERLADLANFVRHFGVREVFFAFVPNLANDTLMMTIEDALGEFGLVFTKIAQGIPNGVAIENIDLLSLARAVNERREI